MYREDITIDHTKVEASLTNFPVLIDITDSNLKNHAQPDGDDIAFVDSSNTIQYNHEIEYYESDTGHLIAWVNVTTVSSVADTILYMYYGNPNCESQQNKFGVWDSNYVMVQHLNESSGVIDDSTNYYNNATNNGATYTATAKIDGGYYFDGQTDVMTVGDNPTLNFTSSMTIELWVKADGAPTQYDAIITKDNDDLWDAGYGMWYDSDSEVRYWVGKDYSTQYAAKTGVTTTNWNYVVGTCDGTTIKLYVNRVKGTDDNGAPTAVGGNLELGRGQSDSYNLKGWLDEVRISKIARSVGWINTSYQNMNDPTTFTNLGTEEQRNLNITIKNTGSITLKTSEFTLLINGTTYQCVSSCLYLHPQKEVNLTVSLTAVGAKRLKVITANGISDYYEYTT
jgi:MSHA biogenesis protein MshQ